MKNQCAKDYFYGKDLAIEKYLTLLEGEYARIIEKIGDGEGDLTSAEGIALRRFVYLQYSRTEQAVKRRTEGMSQMDTAARP